MFEDLTNETVDLLQALIRNACVNDGSKGSGNEQRSVDTLLAYLEPCGVDFQLFEPAPARTSFVGRIPGTDPNAPSLCLMGHTDVVPVSPSGWRHDPFGGELIDGEIWGRGAVDMLNLTSSMAVVFRHLATGRKKYPGDIVFFAVADEEAGGTYGAGQLVPSEWELLQSEYVLTEYGGIPSFDRKRLSITTAEKGIMWRRIVVRGTPGHGSMPYGADNALVKAAEVIRRISEYRPNPLLDTMWKERIQTLDLDPEQRKKLLDPQTMHDVFAELPVNEAKNAHACSHTTFTPTVVSGGVKTNVIPDEVVIDIDIRSLPGETEHDITSHLQSALGNLWDAVSCTPIHSQPASSSASTGRLWNTVAKASQIAYPGSQLVASLVSGATDARFYREKGSIVYGAGLLSGALSGADFFSRFHGHNERIDTESLRLTTNFWIDIFDIFWSE